MKVLTSSALAFRHGLPTDAVRSEPFEAGVRDCNKVVSSRSGGVESFLAEPLPPPLFCLLQHLPNRKKKHVRAKAESCSIPGKLMPVKNGSLGPNTVVNSNQKIWELGSPPRGGSLAVRSKRERSKLD